ncbi:MAG: lipopolysaccharide kinase InaA family protein, partial [Porticoccaceae bacterium]|nr:lipopolysaccharide kinase InaA family protein [Porticoccaceae bacterium]
MSDTLHWEAKHVIQISSKDSPPRQRKSGQWRYLIGDIPGLDDIFRLSESDNIDTDDIPFSKHLTERRDVHSSQATRVYQATLISAGQRQSIFVKHFHARSTADKCKQLARKSRAMKAVMADALLNEHGFIAPKLLIIAWQQNYGIKKNYFTVTTALEGYKDIYQQVEAFSGPGRKSKKEFLVALASATAALHKTNISHGDMRPGNILCKHDKTWQFAYIDNERTKKHWRLPTRTRIKNLVQLNLLISQEISRSDRLRF